MATSYSKNVTTYSTSLSAELRVKAPKHFPTAPRAPKGSPEKGDGRRI
jgi:hypothetical protein